MWALQSLQPASAAARPAVDLVVKVGELSMQARALQFVVRDTAPANRANRANNYGALRVRVERERRTLFSPLLTTMAAAAPDLRLCSHAAASCDCEPDADLMREAERQVEAVTEHIALLDAALASRQGFDEIDEIGGAALYLGGAVEREIEEICECADRFLVRPKAVDPPALHAGLTRSLPCWAHTFRAGLTRAAPAAAAGLVSEAWVVSEAWLVSEAWAFASL